MKKIWQYIRGVFAPGRASLAEDREEVFVPVDVDRLKAELRLAELARRHGESELPATADAIPDGPQLAVQQRVGEHVSVAFRRANRRLRSLHDAMMARAIHSLVDEARRVPQRLRQEIDAKTVEAERAIADAERRRAEAEESIRRYRERHALERGPRLREGHEKNVVLAITLLLALVQAGANALLFAQGMRYGLSMALVYAALLGVFDVVWHFIAGGRACRVTAPDWKNRLVGGVFLLALAATVVVYNLGVVHLRHLILTVFESKSRGYDGASLERRARSAEEHAVMEARWGEVMRTDRGLNPHWLMETLPLRMLRWPSEERILSYIEWTGKGEAWILPRHELPRPAIPSGDCVRSA